MGKHEKLVARILHGGADANVAFSDLCRLLCYLGFAERVAASHHVFTRPGVEEMINLQEAGSKAKVYQVRQVRAILLKHRLGCEAEEGPPG